MQEVLIVGGGAAGLMAAIQAAEAGAKVSIIEKNNRLGKKILITGKGRCNITNAGEIEDLIKNMVGNGTFLYGPFYTFTNEDLIALLKSWGLETKVERGNRVFPVEDRAGAVVEAFEKKIRSLGVKIHFNQDAAELLVKDGKLLGVRTKNGEIFTGEKVIIATGGLSYPKTGSTGGGYKLAKQVGHSVMPLRPALVPLETKEEWVKELQGLALKNVEVNVIVNKRKITSEFGEMLFTHFGLSGPIILTLSGKLVPLLDQGQQVNLEINLKPALTLEQLNGRLIRDFEKFARKQYKNALVDLLPHSMVPVMIKLSGIDPDKSVHQITREERQCLLTLLTALTVTVSKARSIDEAIVTAGGVNVKEIDPRTLESKILPGLYFAGEVIDVHGNTGGFNLQAAFSTGYLAGRSAAEE